MATKKKAAKAPKAPKPKKFLYVQVDESGYPMNATTTKGGYLELGDAEFQYQLVKMVAHKPVPPDAPNTF